MAQKAFLTLRPSRQSASLPKQRESAISSNSFSAKFTTRTIGYLLLERWAHQELRNQILSVSIESVIDQVHYTAVDTPTTADRALTCTLNNIQLFPRPWFVRISMMFSDFYPTAGDTLTQVQRTSPSWVYSPGYLQALRNWTMRKPIADWDIKHSDPLDEILQLLTTSTWEPYLISRVLRAPGFLEINKTLALDQCKDNVIKMVKDLKLVHFYETFQKAFFAVKSERWYKEAGSEFGFLCDFIRADVSSDFMDVVVIGSAGIWGMS